MSAPVENDQRYSTRDGRTCPVCGGGADDPRGEGIRCSGYLSGSRARCSRNATGQLGDDGNYGHRLGQACPCGTTHAVPAWARQNGAAASGAMTDADMLDIGANAPDPVVRIPKGPPIAFEIRDSDGMLTAIHWRQYYTNGEKDLWWTLPDGVTRNLNGRHPNTLPFYNSELMTGVRDIVFTEGEPAAKALTDLRINAVATVTGSSGVPEADVVRMLVAILVKPTRAFLWPDNDADGGGFAHMARLAARLRAAGVQDIRLVTWADAPEGGDAADFARGRTRDDFKPLFRASIPFPGFEPDPEGATTLIAPEIDRTIRKVSKSRVWRIKDFVKNVRAFEYLWERLGAYGTVLACTGPRGRGKTYLLIGLARAILLKYDTYLGLTIRRRTGRVLLVLSDDAASLVKLRMEQLGLAAHPDLYIMSADDWSGDPLAVLGSIPDHVQRIGGVDLIGIDAKYVFIPNEANAGNDAGLTGRFVDVLGTTTATTGSMVWLNDHDNRAGGIMSGSAIVQHEMLTILHLESVGEADDDTAIDTTLTVEKQKALARQDWPKPARLTQDGDGMWTVVGAERDLREAETAEDLGPVVLKVLAEATKPLTGSAIATITGRRKKDVIGVLTALWSREACLQTGKGTKGKPFLYAKNAVPDPILGNSGTES